MPGAVGFAGSPEKFPDNRAFLDGGLRIKSMPIHAVPRALRRSAAGTMEAANSPASDCRRLARLPRHGEPGSNPSGVGAVRVHAPEGRIAGLIERVPIACAKSRLFSESNPLHRVMNPIGLQGSLRQCVTVSARGSGCTRDRLEHRRSGLPGPRPACPGLGVRYC